MKIVLEKGQRLFFTSDTHYGHSNICSATTKWSDSDSVTRDFKSLEHMNDTLVNRINETVGENDILIHLGDFSFGGFENIQEFRSRIVCKNLHLIHGNHDHHIRRNKGDIQDIFTTCSDYIHLDLRIPNGSGTRKYTFVCMHYPICSWDGMNADVMHLHGHVHLPPHLRIAEGRAMDVGCDGNNLYPMNVEEVISLLRNRPIAKLTLPKDHHEKRLI